MHPGRVGLVLAQSNHSRPLEALLQLASVLIQLHHLLLAMQHRLPLALLIVPHYLSRLLKTSVIFFALLGVFLVIIEHPTDTIVNR